MRRSEKEDLSTDPCQATTFIEFDDLGEPFKIIFLYIPNDSFCTQHLGLDLCVNSTPTPKFPWGVAQCSTNMMKSIPSIKLGQEKNSKAFLEV